MELVNILHQKQLLAKVKRILKASEQGLNYASMDSWELPCQQCSEKLKFSETDSVIFSLILGLISHG